MKRPSRARTARLSLRIKGDADKALRSFAAKNSLPMREVIESALALYFKHAALSPSDQLLVANLFYRSSLSPGTPQS